MSLLLSYAAESGFSCHEGPGPLVVAARHGHVEVVKRLLQFEGKAPRLEAALVAASKEPDRDEVSSGRTDAASAV